MVGSTSHLLDWLEQQKNSQIWIVEMAYSLKTIIIISISIVYCMKMVENKKLKSEYNWMSFGICSVKNGIVWSNLFHVWYEMNKKKFSENCELHTLIYIIKLPKPK